jgi:hypothetical protein
MKKDINAAIREEMITAALKLLKFTILQTGTGIALDDGRLIFFGAEDYKSVGDINKIPRFGVSLEELTRLNREGGDEND